MKKSLRILALLFAFVMVVGVFAACKDDNNTTEKPVLKVGTNPEFPPFEFLVGNDMDGFDIALMEALAEKMGMKVQWERMDFKALISAIGSRIDVAIAGMTVTEERQLEVNFTDTYFEAKQYVLVAADNDSITSVEDLNGLKIGVQEGTTGDFIASDDIEGAVVSRYSKAVMAVQDLMAGNLDAVIIDRNPAMEFESLNADKIKIIGEDFFEDEFYAIAVAKNQTELLQKLNDALAEIKADGTFDALVEKYIVAETNNETPIDESPSDEAPDETAEE